MNEITVFAPATIGNVGVGFDILGLAIHEPGDEVTLRKRKKPGVAIMSISGDDQRLPREAYKNTAGVAVIQFLEYIHAAEGVDLELHKMMPMASGLGSSAASAVAAVFAANELFGRPLSRKHLLPFVMEAERVACGAPHADNAAPSLLGGLVLIRSYDPLDVIQITTPKNLHVAVVHPNVEVRTEEARQLLGDTISLKKAVTQWGHAAGFITGILTHDFDLIGRSLQDVVAEPLRAGLIPGFYPVKHAALKAGALGSNISGSGPSVFALCQSGAVAQRVGRAMQTAFLAHKIASDLYISEVNQDGPRVISHS